LPDPGPATQQASWPVLVTALCCSGESCIRSYCPRNQAWRKTPCARQRRGAHCRRKAVNFSRS
jgi:hypothetical protein